MAVLIFRYFTFRLLFKFCKNLEKYINAIYDTLFTPQYMFLCTILTFLVIGQLRPIADIIKVSNNDDDVNTAILVDTIPLC